MRPRGCNPGDEPEGRGDARKRESLVGASILDCHPEPARSKVRELLSSGRTNVYTIEKKAVRKLICQSPWFEDGEMRGLVELSLELPDPLPHHVRE